MTGPPPPRLPALLRSSPDVVREKRRAESLLLTLDLTEDQKASLGPALEELVRRLHLVESGLSLGADLDLSDWPGNSG